MIELKNVCAGYGKSPVLENVSLEMEKGKLCSVIGVNGCGKSTLLKTMLGLLPVSGGELLIDGAQAGELSRTEIARKIAYLTQGRNTPDMTVEQMVLHGRFPHLSYPRRYSAADRDIARAAMEQLGLGALAKKPLYALSGGQRQNAYIAMALAQGSDYVLLDEPTTYLDIGHQLELMQTLKKLAEGGRGIMAVLHDLPLAFAFSDYVLLMDKGRIVCRGRPEELWASGAVEEVFGVRLSRSDDGSYSYRY